MAWADALLCAWGTMRRYNFGDRAMRFVTGVDHILCHFRFADTEAAGAAFKNILEPKRKK